MLTGGPNLQGSCQILMSTGGIKIMKEIGITILGETKLKCLLSSKEVRLPRCMTHNDCIKIDQPK